MNKYIKRNARIIAVLPIGFMLPLSANAASFDCAKAGTKVEHIICDNAEISKLDDDLSTAYKVAVQDKQQADAIKQAQKQWMKERNGCADADCVKRAYEARLLSLTRTQTSSGEGPVTNKDAGSISRNGQRYQFQLTKGKGVPVCDAYLERLNATEYEDPPFCGRPENDAVKGFAKLNRVPLSPADVHDLFPIVTTYMGMANQKSLNWADMGFQLRLTQTGQSRLTEEGVKYLQRSLDHGEAKMWRYDPVIDIDNDGMPDNVEVWYGSIVRGVGGVRCGDDLSGRFGKGLLRQPQMAFVITGSNDRLDAFKTNKIFGHPKGAYRLSNGQFSNDYHPIGNTIGIFEYQSTYYFDTFFDGWGDFDGKRQNDRNMINTLGVFLHKDSKTTQVCEYLMTENERGAK